MWSGCLHSLDQYIQAGQLILLFHLHQEMDLLAQAIEVLQKGIQLSSYMWPDDEGVAHISEPELWLSVSGHQCCLLEVLHEESCYHRREG